MEKARQRNCLPARHRHKSKYFACEFLYEVEKAKSNNNLRAESLKRDRDRMKPYGFLSPFGAIAAAIRMPLIFCTKTLSEINSPLSLSLSRSLLCCSGKGLLYL